MLLDCHFLVSYVPLATLDLSKMGPRLDVPETDPRFGAGTRICEHLEGVGDALTADEKDGLAHIIRAQIKIL